MALVRVGSLKRLPPGEVMEAVVNGEPFAVCNTGGEIRALGGVCPHSGGPLGQGALHEDYLCCPWHAWAFDCRTGAFDYNDNVRVPTYPVTVAGDDILIDIP